MAPSSTDQSSGLPSQPARVLPSNRGLKPSWAERGERAASRTASSAERGFLMGASFFVSNQTSVNGTCSNGGKWCESRLWRLEVSGWRLANTFSGPGSRPSGPRFRYSGAGTGSGPVPVPAPEEPEPDTRSTETRDLKMFFWSTEPLGLRASRVRLCCPFEFSLSLLHLCTASCLSSPSPIPSPSPKSPSPPSPARLRSGGNRVLGDDM